MSTPCDCKTAGYCARHKITKDQTLFEKCQTDMRYFNQWESGDSPQHQFERMQAAGTLPVPEKPLDPTPENFPCIYRGEKSGSVECKSCGGARTLDVYPCSKYEKCTIESTGLPSADKDYHKCCLSCDDRTEAPLTKVIIRDSTCPGDIAVLTGALAELHHQHPKKFATDVRTNHPALWEGSSLLTNLDESEEGVIQIDAHYDPDKQEGGKESYATIHQSSQRPIHMLEAYCESLSVSLKIPPLRPHRWLEPSIWLSQDEKNWFSQVQELTGRPTPFWIVNAGSKSDYTAKLWPYYQEAINLTKHAITWVQIGLTEHQHRPLDGALDLIGQTDLRKLVRLVYHSAGVLTGVSSLMHLAHWVERGPNVPFRRPAVVIAGGRESPHWFSYPGHHVFHTIGELDCCQHGGCWRSRVEPIRINAQDHNGSLCDHPVDGFPLCMRRIEPEQVAHTILRLAK